MSSPLRAVWPLLAGLGLLSLLFIPVPGSGRVSLVGPDLLHAPLFALLTWKFCPRLITVIGERPFTAALAGWLIATFAGGAIEYLQAFVGRHASRQDAIANGFGAFAGAALYLRGAVEAQHLRRTLKIVAIGVIAAASLRPMYLLTDTCRQYLTFPLLAGFESRSEMTRIRFNECEGIRSREVAADGEWSLKLELQPAQYSGLNIDVPGNWDQYQSLKLDVYNAVSEPVELVMKINDRQHNGKHEDRFHTRLRLAPGWNAVSVRLADVRSAPHGRNMRLDQIADLSLFTVELEQPITIYLDHLRLEKLSL